MRFFLWLLLGVSIFAACLLIESERRANQPFQFVMTRPGPTRADERVLVFSRQPVAAPEFRAAAADYAAQWHPQADHNIAVHFFASLPAAQIGNEYEAALTDCLYRDGTPAAWMEGGGDCFSKRKP
jgi:hypothetical protein